MRLVATMVRRGATSRSPASGATPSTQVLEVVEHEQQLERAQMLAEPGRPGCAVGLAQAECLTDRRQQELGIAERGELDHHGAVGELGTGR